MAHPSVQDAFNAAYGAWLPASPGDIKPRGIAWYFYNKGLRDAPEVKTMEDTTNLSGAPDTIKQYVDRDALKALCRLEFEPVTKALTDRITALVDRMARNRQCQCTDKGVCESCGAIFTEGVARLAAQIEADKIADELDRRGVSLTDDPDYSRKVMAMDVGIDPATPGSDRTVQAVTAFEGNERKTYPIPEGWGMVPADGTIMPGDRIWASLDNCFTELDADHWLVGMPVTGKNCVIRLRPGVGA